MALRLFSLVSVSKLWFICKREDPTGTLVIPAKAGIYWKSLTSQSALTGFPPTRERRKLVVRAFDKAHLRGNDGREKRRSQLFGLRRGFGLYLLALVFAFLVGACSPSLTVLHRDPSHPEVRVVVDKTEVEELALDEEVSIKLSEGEHYVEVHPKGENVCPWTKDGKGWTVWLEKDAILTLLPPPKEVEKQEPSVSGK